MTHAPSAPTRRACLALLCAAALTPLGRRTARAQSEIRIGLGYGIAFTPVYIMDELKLVEKHAKAAGLDTVATFSRFSGTGPMQDALLSGAIDAGPLGVSAILIAHEKARGTAQEMLAVSGVTTLPLVLVTSRPGIKTLADFKPSDRIAMPSIVSPQMYLLQMQCVKEFGKGQQDRLRGQVVALPHPEALNALLTGGTEVTAYFSSPPFTQAALKNPKISAVMSSTDVMGQASFLIMGAVKRAIDANPKMPEVIARAVDEAAALIRNEPRRAAEIYLKHEPSRMFDLAAMTAIFEQYPNDFGSAVRGVQAYADFMGSLGQLKNPPKSWKEVVTPSIRDTPSS